MLAQSSAVNQVPLPERTRWHPCKHETQSALVSTSNYPSSTRTGHSHVLQLTSVSAGSTWTRKYRNKGRRIGAPGESAVWRASKSCGPFLYLQQVSLFVTNSFCYTFIPLNVFLCLFVQYLMASLSENKSEKYMNGAKAPLDVDNRMMWW